jgi:hypothetical protein
MTLAEILLVGIFCTVPAAPCVAATRQAAPPSPSQNKSSQTEGTRDQGAGSPSTPSNTSQPPSTGTSSSSHNPSKTKKRRRHKRRVIASNCTPAAARQAGSESTSSTVAPSGAGTTGNAATAATSSAPTNCPPSKVIVRQGGTAEPSIQLGGGAASASQQRDTANQMLGTTEANLKKIAGRQLTSDQQNMVNQIRQFKEQSKAALGDGDLDRARTLAWKAQVLSEELVKPAK